MFVSKVLISFMILCLVRVSLSKPFETDVIEGRGIGSTIWGWITYPFSWWSSDDSDVPPENDQLIGLTSINSFENIEVSKRNVTIWCNDQTCTTMRCDKFGCTNISCSIYDTDFNGECRNYNTGIKPEEPTTTKTSHSQPLPTYNIPEINLKPTTLPTTTITSTTDFTSTIEERPLELEAVLSSTVTEKSDNTENTDFQKVADI